MKIILGLIKCIVQGTFEVLHIAVISAIVGTGLAYGALVGIGLYTALNG